MYLTDEMIEDAFVVIKEFLARCNVANIHDYTYSYQSELL